MLVGANVGDRITMGALFRSSPPATSGRLRLHVGAEVRSADRSVGRRGCNRQGVPGVIKPCMT